MASGSKTNSVFTEQNMGDGPSTGIKKEKIANGQTIMSAYPQDNVHGVELMDTMGCKMRGGPNNLEHSLKGASAVQDGPGAAGPVKHVRVPGGH